MCTCRLFHELKDQVMFLCIKFDTSQTFHEIREHFLCLSKTETILPAFQCQKSDFKCRLRGTLHFWNTANSWEPEHQNFDEKNCLQRISTIDQLILPVNSYNGKKIVLSVEHAILSQSFSSVSWNLLENTKNSPVHVQLRFMVTCLSYSERKWTSSFRSSSHRFQFYWACTTQKTFIFYLHFIVPSSLFLGLWPGQCFHKPVTFYKKL